MADYRTVKTSMWAQDEWFMDLPIDGKLLWIYLFTNSHTSVAGIYKLPLRTIAFESGIEPSRAQQLLDLFSTADKAHFEDGVVWIVKMREHQASSSALVEKRIKLDVEALPDTPLKRKYCRKYGIDMVSIGYLENDLETETETETETDKKQTAAGASSNGLLDSEIGSVYACWEENMSGTMTPFIADQLTDLVNTYTAKEVIRAIGIAVNANVRNMKYVTGVLRNRAAGDDGKRTNGAKPKTKLAPVLDANGQPIIENGAIKTQEVQF